MNYESELVIRAKNGDANALNLLLDHNKSYIYAIAFALLKNHEDAEDAVQKAMITVWQSIGSLENPEAFKSWLYRIAHTRSLNVLQSKKNNQVILDDDISDMPQLENMESELMLPQAYAERDDLRDRLYRIIDGLSAVQRETIVLYYFNDRSVAEIAEIMDCSENTVKSRLYLARHSIKTEIEEQERKSGEKFYGIAVGALPIGYFVAEHIKHSLPSTELLGNLVTSAQKAGQNTVPQVANGSSVSGKVGSVATKTAAKGLPTAVKAVIATVGIAAVSVAGVMTAKMIADGQHNDTAPIETQAVIEATASPTGTPTEVPTEAPTVPDYTDAYRAYLKELEDNKDKILDYDWQASGGDTKPVVFADIMGDDTPEMIYVYAEKVYSTQNGHNMGNAGMRVFTYRDGGIKQAYHNSNWSQNYAQVSDEPYLLFQTQDNKALYAYCNTSKTYASFTVLRFSDNGDGSLSEETAVSLFYGFSEDMGREAEINGSLASVSEAEQETRGLIESRSSALMIAANGKDIYQDRILQDIGIDPGEKENQAMTYEEAVAYLKEQIGESSNTQDNDPPKEDYSVISGTYSASFFRKYLSSLTIHSDGSFETEFYFDPASPGQGSKNDPAEYSYCRGRINNLTQTDNYTYTFDVTDISYDYPVGESGDITYTDTYTHTDNSMYADFVKHPFDTEGTMTFYAKGITPTDMKDSHFTSYVFPENPNTSERASTSTSGNMIYISYGSKDHVYYEQ